MPTERELAAAAKKPVTPTTALSRSSASVTAGIVEVDASLPRVCRRSVGGQRVDVDLEADRERGARD